MIHTTLTEHVADWHAGRSVDRGARTVRNVALAGGVSKNGYRYTEQALREAAVLYEHKPVFLDHARDRGRPHERSTRDLVGTIVNPRFEAGRIRGDIRVLDTDSGRTFLALAESDTPEVGMSHVVRARRSTGDGPVEQIEDVVSVDAVVFPATTRTFRESTGSDDAEASPEDLQQRVRQLIRQRDSLQEELETIREQQALLARERRLQEELDAAGLPAGAVTELFLEQLRSADESGRRALIAERRRLLAEARRQPPLSAERQSVRSTAAASAAFVAAVRRH